MPVHNVRLTQVYHIPRCNNGWTWWHRWNAAWRRARRDDCLCPSGRVWLCYCHHHIVFYCRLWLLSLILTLSHFFLLRISFWDFNIELASPNLTIHRAHILRGPRLLVAAFAAEVKDPGTTWASSRNPRSGRPPSSTIRCEDPPEGVMFGLFG